MADYTKQKDLAYNLINKFGGYFTIARENTIIEYNSVLDINVMGNGKVNADFTSTDLISCQIKDGSFNFGLVTNGGHIQILSTFMFNNKSYQMLELAGMPSNLTRDLQTLKNVEFNGYTVFLTAVETVIGVPDTTLYKDIIIKYTNIDSEKIKFNSCSYDTVNDIYTLSTLTRGKSNTKKKNHFIDDPVYLVTGFLYYNIYGVLTSRSDKLDDRAIYGQNVLLGDKFLLVASKDLAIDLNLKDKVIIGSELWNIINIITVNPSNDPILYKAQIRKGAE